METHSSMLAWEIPWKEEPSGLWGHQESDMTEHTAHNFIEKLAQRTRLIQNT